MDPLARRTSSRRRLLALVVALAAPAAAGAREIHVHAGRGDDWTGNGSRLRPWRTLNRALAASRAGDHVRLAAGTYDWSRNREYFPIFVPSGVSVHGAGAGRTVVRDDNPTSRAVALLLANGDHVGATGGEWTIERLELEGVARAGSFYPAAVQVTSRVGTGPTLRHNVMSGFLAAVRIGADDPGCSAVESRTLVDGNLLRANDTGVLVSLSVADPCFRETQWAERSELRSNVFHGNRVGVRLEASGGTGVILQNRIWNNSFAGQAKDAIQAASADCGGVRVQASIGNNVIAFNGGLGVDAAACGVSLDVRHNDFYANLAAQGWGTDVAVDPGFTDLQNGDLHLRAGSPVIDLGVALYAPPLDYDGDARPQGSAPDLGADEHLPRDSADPFFLP